MLHIIAIFGVISNVGVTTQHANANVNAADSLVWNIVIGAWLFSGLAILVYMAREKVYDTRYWRWTTYALSLLTTVGLIHVTWVVGSENLFTDVMLFVRYSADLFIQGTNPYTVSMGPASDIYQSINEVPAVTKHVDGSLVTTFSYPALSFLAFVPQRLAEIPNVSLTVMIVFSLLFLFLARETPHWMFPGVAVALLFNQYVFSNAYFGNIDPLWILPLALGMHYWYHGRLPIAAFIVGIAFAAKQIPWFIGPFVAIWLWKDPAYFNRSRWNAIGISLTSGIAGFLLPNLYFIFDAPSEWLLDVFSPVGSRLPFQTRGTGLAVLVHSGAFDIPKIGFKLLLIIVVLLSMTVYYLYFEQMKWAAWVLPCMIFFFNDRSLFNYFVTFIPLAYYAILLNRNLVPDRPLLSKRSLTTKVKRLARTSAETNQ
ncbi:glycosyltransferase family 87 protein [Halogeometricum sp. CBA1124]|uniref:glycosyltransferase family 87 protein n=1 Tax=Halogeometricum sp. CBA1124 TaxID=2668071 RepID=UPI0018D26856|nr:glycosyltransferase 87 family protein [Halogeometricum sp. CBA1124]